MNSLYTNQFTLYIVDMFSAVVIGHSFVRCAKKIVTAHLEGTCHNLRLTDFTINWLCYSGLTINQLDWKSHRLYHLKPDIVIIDIGTNDLSADGICPNELAWQVCGVASFIYDLVPSVKVVFILDIYRRARWCTYPTQQDFNQCVIQYNLEWRRLCHISTLPVYAAPLKGLDVYRLYLSSDGVHLCRRKHRHSSHSGIFHYVMAIRRALVRCSHLCH